MALTLRPSIFSHNNHWKSLLPYSNNFSIQLHILNRKTSIIVFVIFRPPLVYHTNLLSKIKWPTVQPRGNISISLKKNYGHMSLNRKLLTITFSTLGEIWARNNSWKCYGGVIFYGSPLIKNTRDVLWVVFPGERICSLFFFVNICCWYSVEIRQKIAFLFLLKLAPLNYVSLVSFPQIFT